MHTQRVHVSGLPLFTNSRARCAQCGGGPPIWVIFCRGCSTVEDGRTFTAVASAAAIGGSSRRLSDEQ
jgi:hypothetical protein